VTVGGVFAKPIVDQWWPAFGPSADETDSQPIDDEIPAIKIETGPLSDCSDVRGQEVITWTFRSNRIPNPSQYYLSVYHCGKQCLEVDVLGVGKGMPVPPSAENRGFFEVKISADQLFCSKRSSIKDFEFRCVCMVTIRPCLTAASNFLLCHPTLHLDHRFNLQSHFDQVILLSSLYDGSLTANEAGRFPAIV
jgi:hypothetical protein